MGKRSNFKRKERDFYPTPYKAVLPLQKHIEEGFRFIEPCAGDGALIGHLFNIGGDSCWIASDIEPQCDSIYKMDALDYNEDNYNGAEYYDYIITNPPWDRKILHPMINHFRKIAPTWLLFDADWMHTRQSAPYMKYCHKVVSVGRVKWIPDSKHTGKENCCWYLFDICEAETIFYGRES